LNFWFSGHSGCQSLFSKLKVVKEHFAENNDIVFLSVSIDSKELWKRTVKYYGIKGENGFTEGKGMEHPIINAYKVERFPTSFVIDRKGYFYNANPSENPLDLINQLETALKEQLVMGKVHVENKNNKN
jgi:cytochrome oxidase Cu insertion factor (SCO1/SenC/PrrC family)